MGLRKLPPACCKYDVCNFPIEGVTQTATYKNKTTKVKYFTNVTRKGKEKRVLPCPNQIQSIQGKTFKNVNNTRKLKNMRDLDNWCNIKNTAPKNFYITKNIFILWLQGFENAPPIIKKCVKTWEKHNKNWNIIKLDEKNLTEYVNIDDYVTQAQQKNMKRNHFANIIRLLLLVKYGGCWVDATNYCVKPLDDWIYNHFTEGFFVFERDGYGPNRCIGNWFIYGEKDNYMLKKWLEATLDFWKNKNSAEYYHWHIRLFNNLLHTDKTFKEKWGKINKISGIGPYGPLALNKGANGAGLFKDIDDNKIYNITHKMAPFYKLSWKHHDIATKNSVINYFMNL
jgi:hypothetical protein